MERRRLGRTGHESSVVTLGAYAFGVLDQRGADELIDFALSHGINQIDIAPSYADAEIRLSDYLKRHPLPEVFIGCKTQKRSREEAREELLRTMDRLGRDQLDLYQLHAVCDMSDLEACFAAGGSMETLVEALEQGLVKNVGITGHGWSSPATHLAALDRFPFATVMTSANLFMVQNDEFRRDWETLTSRCRRDDIGVHLLKATAKGAWGAKPHTHTTWYEPLTDAGDIQKAVAWALQQPITTICSAGDATLVATICDAAERYREVDPSVQQELLPVYVDGDFFVEA